MFTNITATTQSPPTSFTLGLNETLHLDQNITMTSLIGTKHLHAKTLLIIKYMEKDMMRNGDFLYEFPPLLNLFWYVCYSLIIMLTIAGNGLVIWVILSSSRMRNVTNYYIANLAVADFLLGIFVIPFEFLAAINQSWIFPHFMCPICPFIQSVTINVSVYTLTAIAIDRQRVILNPFSQRPTKRIYQIVILIIWLVSIVMSFPIGYAMVVEAQKNRFFCFPRRIYEPLLRYYRIGNVLVQYAVPLCVMAWAYTTIAIALWGNKAPGNPQFIRDESLMNTKKRVIKMLILVVILFGLCWLPLHVFNIVYLFFPEIRYFKYVNVLFFSIDWFAMSNSCYNPFIYAIYNEKFKEEFKMRIAKFRLRCRNRSTFSPNSQISKSLFFSSKHEWKDISAGQELI